MKKANGFLHRLEVSFSVLYNQFRKVGGYEVLCFCYLCVLANLKGGGVVSMGYNSIGKV